MNETAENVDQELRDPNAKHQVLEFKTGTERVRVYVLNPGDYFAGFGGSRSGLQVRKTGSLVTRHQQSNGVTQDTEWDLNAAEPWGWIRQMIAAGWSTPLTR